MPDAWLLENHPDVYIRMLIQISVIKSFHMANWRVIKLHDFRVILHESHELLSCMVCMNE